MALLQQLMLKALPVTTNDQCSSAATVLARSLPRRIGPGSATGDVRRPSYLGIRTVAKLANRVAARVGRSDMAPAFIGWR